MRGTRFLSLLTGFSALLTLGTAQAGAVADQFRGGAFGLPWSAGKSAIEAKYPGGTWDTDDAGAERYCAASRQPLLGLPAQHQTRELCFLVGNDGTLASATANMEPSLPSLLAVVNRARTRFGDFDAVKRDEGAVQSRYTYLMWTRDEPIVVVVGSRNDDAGRPDMVAFTVADEPSLFTRGAEKVANRPAGAR